ncbi:hypothetical protein HMPREF0378_1020 [Eubacterium nodatum ATCC 33099]|nr:hypothetical protein HMPREF0378_1020 [Eubacterium nodatum ATCC 33099]
MGVASLVLGIVSILCGVFSAGVFGWVGAIIGAIGTILGALGRKNPETKSIGTAGLVCSIIGLVLGIILYAACVACASGTATSLNSVLGGN